MADAYKYEPHSFKARKNSYKPVCDRCGLIALNNTFTRWSIDKAVTAKIIQTTRGKGKWPVPKALKSKNNYEE